MKKKRTKPISLGDHDVRYLIEFGELTLHKPVKTDGCMGATSLIPVDELLWQGVTDTDEGQVPEGDPFQCPWTPGARTWIRESFRQIVGQDGRPAVEYRADAADEGDWIPPMWMRKADARLVVDIDSITTDELDWVLHLKLVTE